MFAYIDFIQQWPPKLWPSSNHVHAQRGEQGTHNPGIICMKYLLVSSIFLEINKVNDEHPPAKSSIGIGKKWFS